MKDIFHHALMSKLSTETGKKNWVDDKNKNQILLLYDIVDTLLMLNFSSTYKSTESLLFILKSSSTDYI